MNVRALIAEDEAHVAADLRARLSVLWPQLQIVGVAGSGTEALERIEAAKPEIAFLDIRMPGLSGLEVVQRLQHRCLLVFVTAYDQYAVEAFERAAVDYLVKPVSDERLARTVARLQQAVQSAAVPDMAALLETLQRLTGAQAGRIQWIKASLRDKLHLVSVDDVCYFQSSDKYTGVFTRDAELLIRTPIKELVLQLDPDRFWQIHRGTIVNVRQILQATTDDDGQMLLKLRDRPELLAVSRSYTHLFKQM